MGTEEDLEIGRGLVALFNSFIQHLIDQGLAKKTIKNHGNNWTCWRRDYPESRSSR